MSKYKFKLLIACLVVIAIGGILLYCRPFKSTLPIRSVGLYTHVTTLSDLTPAEQKEILKVFRIKIPETETNISVRCFNKTEYDMFYIELDGINDRRAFYSENSVDKPSELHMPRFWDKANPDGSYIYYFYFTVNMYDNYHKQSEYAIAISELFDELCGR